MSIGSFISRLMVIAESVSFVLAFFYLCRGFVKRGAKTKNREKFHRYAEVYIVLNLIRHIVDFVQKRSYSVSIIGGADGPTSVFLAGKINHPKEEIFAAGVLVGVAAAVIITKIRKK